MLDEERLFGRLAVKALLFKKVVFVVILFLILCLLLSGCAHVHHVHKEKECRQVCVSFSHGYCTKWDDDLSCRDTLKPTKEFEKWWSDYRKKNQSIEI